jgi:hypothetical protein
VQLKVWVKRKQEDEALTHGARCAEYTCNCVRQCLAVDIIYAPHFFLGKSRLCEVKCSASMFVVVDLKLPSRLRFLRFLDL